MNAGRTTPADRRLSRSIGLTGLTFVGLGGMLGSGWLFGPLFAAQSAGPAAIVAWIVGGLMMLLTALCFAETAAMFPVAGGLARQPVFSHGNVVGIFVGWAAWIGYVTQAPIETQAMLEYASNESAFRWLFVESGPAAGGQAPLSVPGIIVAVLLLALFTAVNAWGVRAFTRINTQLTWFKIAVPILVALVLVAFHFDSSNISSHGLAPGGIDGVLTAISTGGIVFAFIGFRHVLDLAGEAEQPQRTVPLALTLSVVICMAILVLVQLGFMGAIDESELAGGWAHLGFGGANGPVAALLTAVGATWLATTVLADAVVSPFGAALVSTASTSRLAMAVSRNGLFPKALQRLSTRGVPLRALVLNFIAGTLIFVARGGWRQVLAFNTGAIVVSFCMGPVTVVALRHQLPDRNRPFRVPRLEIIAPAAFVVTCWIIYWTGWRTLWQISIPIALGAVLFGIRAWRDEDFRAGLDFRSAAWLPFFYVGLVVLTFTGNFGGGRHWIPFHFDTALVAAFALIIYRIALRCRLPTERVKRYVHHIDGALEGDSVDPEKNDDVS